MINVVTSGCNPQEVKHMKLVIWCRYTYIRIEVNGIRVCSKRDSVLVKNSWPDVSGSQSGWILKNCQRTSHNWNSRWSYRINKYKYYLWHFFCLSTFWEITIWKNSTITYPRKFINRELKNEENVAKQSVKIQSIVRKLSLP